MLRRIAEFLDIPINESKWDAIVEHCTFDHMKRHATQSVPLGGIFWDGGAETFINKGVNGRWTSLLSDVDVRRYETISEQELGKDCARWLATGSQPSMPR